MTAAGFQVIGGVIAVPVFIFWVRWLLRDDVSYDAPNGELAVMIAVAALGSFAVMQVWPVVVLPLGAYLALRLFRRTPAPKDGS